jgi:hypothetical protein
MVVVDHCRIPLTDLPSIRVACLGDLHKNEEISGDVARYRRSLRVFFGHSGQPERFADSGKPPNHCPH